MRKFTPFLALALAAATQTALAQNSGSADNVGKHTSNDAPIVTLSVTGIGRARPDRAIVNAGVQTKAMSATDAIAQNATKMRMILAVLRAEGIADRDVQTASVTLYQDYDYSEKGQIFKGYIANNSVTVRLRDVGKAGTIFDTMVNNGVTSISGPTFLLADDSALTETARKDAMRQAAELSAFYAKTAGYRKARLLSIDENRDFSGPAPTANAKAAITVSGADSTPIAPGELAVQVHITVKYTLEN